jgi:hypothetical protein
LRVVDVSLPLPVKVRTASAPPNMGVPSLATHEVLNRAKGSDEFSSVLP